MQSTVSATFQNPANARDAIADLTPFGLHAPDISVAEQKFGLGTVLGTAQTLTPGHGSNDIATILQAGYPLVVCGGMPGGIVATTQEDVLVSLMGFGMSEDAAAQGATALETGAVLLAVTVEETVAKAVAEVLERNGGQLVG